MPLKQLSEYGIVPTWDLGAIFFLFVLIIFYEVSSGKNKTILSLMGSYFSFAIVSFFPFWSAIADLLFTKAFYLEMGAFWIVAVLIAFFLSRSAGGSFFSFSKIKIGYFFQALIFAVLQTGLLAAISLSFLPEEQYGNLSPVIFRVFLTQPFNFLWVLLPIIGLTFFNTKKNRNSS